MPLQQPVKVPFVCIGSNCEASPDLAPEITKAQRNRPTTCGSDFAPPGLAGRYVSFRIPHQPGR